MEGSSVPVDNVVRYRDGAITTAADWLAAEEPLEIRARGRPVGVTLRTPGHDAELAAGFLRGEGIVRRRHDVLRIEPCDRDENSNVMNVLLAADVYVDFERLARYVLAGSSCGLCGRATIEAVRGRFPPITGDLRVTAPAVLAMPLAMRTAQATFDRTGGLHAAGLFTPDGRAAVVREDVGRHNAVDKVLGHALLNDVDAGRHMLLVSGRLSFEIMQKALAAGVAVVAAVSAPSSLAVEFARENGQTVIGFLREGRMNVYANADRLIPSPGIPGDG